MPRDQGRIVGESYSPGLIAEMAAQNKCRSIAYTHTEPSIYYELARETMVEAKKLGLINVFVTNGYMTRDMLDDCRGLLDAANVDLKAFSERFYQRLCGVELGTVLDTLQFLVHETAVWLEVTTLLIPGENDSDAELEAMCAWIVQRLGPDVPVHFSAFHPAGRMSDHAATPPQTLSRARRLAQAAGVRHVYTGNVHDAEGGSTYCSGCGRRLIRRDWYVLSDWQLAPDGTCPRCGTRLPGRFTDGPGSWGARRQPVDMAAFAAP